MTATTKREKGLSFLPAPLRELYASVPKLMMTIAIGTTMSFRSFKNSAITGQDYDFSFCDISFVAFVS
jgi:hypothetical protein